LAKRGALTGARSVAGIFLQLLLLFHDGAGDDTADISGGGGNVDDASDYSVAVGSKTARHFDCLAARLLRASRESRLCIGYCVLSDTVMDFFLRDGVERDRRIDFDRPISDDLNMLFQALASIHRATSVLLV
jgi:hypothetical protein